MTEENYKVQWSVSLPPAAQYAKGDMLNLRGESVEEVEGILDAVLGGEFIDKASSVAALVRAGAVVNDAFTPTDTVPEQPTTQAQPAANEPIYTCAHGKRTRRDGTNSRGAWTGYFCPLKKGDPAQCEAVWA